jgi:hypothetical protein
MGSDELIERNIVLSVHSGLIDHLESGEKRPVCFGRSVNVSNVLPHHGKSDFYKNRAYKSCAFCLA